MTNPNRKAHWEESFYYDKKTDDVYMIPQCSNCGFHHKGGTYHEQGEIWKLQECPECGAEMEKKKKRWIDE